MCALLWLLTLVASALFGLDEKPEETVHVHEQAPHIAMASSAIDLHLISSARALASATKLEADASFRKFLPEGNLEDPELPVPEACLCRRPQTYSLDQGQKHISEHSLHHHQSGRSAQKSVYQ
jgi:hypothetical protein